MKIGILYKVIRNGHSNPQVGDVVVCLEQVNGSDNYFLGLNRHRTQDLEVLCE